MISTLEAALQALKAGNPIGLPTETVYGLAANAFLDEAIENIYNLKNRPTFNPLIVHVASIEDAKAIATISKTAHHLMTTFWPGPLTLVLPQAESSKLSNKVTAGLKTVAIRCPGHPIAQKVLSALPFPLAAPSANISETVSPTQAQHVVDAFPELPVLDGGPCKAGLESTILDLTSSTPTILRPGSITKDNLEALLQESILCSHATKTDDKDIKAPGQMLKHYAPSIPVRINITHVKQGEALLAFGETELTGKVTKNLSPSGDLNEAASHLFAFLRELDSSSHTGIAVMPIPNSGVGIAINDRLRRAAQK